MVHDVELSTSSLWLFCCECCSKTKEYTLEKRKIIERLENKYYIFTFQTELQSPCLVTFAARYPFLPSDLVSVTLVHIECLLYPYLQRGYIGISCGCYKFTNASSLCSLSSLISSSSRSSPT